MSLSAGKSLFGVSMLAFGGWSFAGAALTEQTFDGVVHAPTVTMYAPASGLLELSSNENSIVAHGDLVAKILAGDKRPPSVAPIGENRSMALRDQIATLEGIEANLDSNLASYTRSRASYLEAQMEQASAIHDSLQIGVEEKEKSVNRARRLAVSGHISSSDVETQEAELRRSRLDLQSAGAKLRSAQIELAAAKNGTFIGEGYNDVPFSSQRKIDVELRITELKRELQEIGEESSRIAEVDSSATLNSPVDGRLWRMNYAEGQFVEVGSPIAQLVNCKRLTAEIELPARYFDQLDEGDTAFLQLAGSSERVATRISRLAAKTWTQSESNRDQSGSVASGSASYTASIDLDTDTLGIACPVGRKVSVVFDNGTPSVPAQIANLSKTYTASIGQFYDRITSLITSELVALGAINGDTQAVAIEPSDRSFGFVTTASAKSGHD